MRRRWFPAAAGGAAFAIAALSAGGSGRRLDERAYRALNGTGGRGADAFFASITELGSIWAPAGAALALSRLGRRREAMDALGAAGAMWALGQVLKRVYLRPRPYRALKDVRLLIAEPSGTTWPSSHPAVLLAFVSVAAKNLDAPPAARSALSGLAVLVGLSRVYLGVHYPTDVAGGLLLGAGLAGLWSQLISPGTAGAAPDRGRLATVSG
jgi:membrane-associated phospholipid phosphatase